MAKATVSTKPAAVANAAARVAAASLPVAPGGGTGSGKIFVITGKCEIAKLSCEGSLAFSGDVSDVGLVAAAALATAGAAVTVIEAAHIIKAGEKAPALRPAIAT